jgi:hypothetical protein
MVFIVLKDGRCLGVEAVAAGRKGDNIVCLDENGYEVARFAAWDVEVFTRDEREARALERAVSGETAPASGEQLAGDGY